MKVLISDKLAPEGIALLQDQGFTVDEKTGLSPDELKGIIGDYDGLIIRSATQVTADLVSHAHKLIVVGRAGTGVDNIDIDACTARGIIVCNTPGSNTNAAAELAVGLAFAIFRHIPKANAMTHQDDFRKGKLSGSELEGKTAGIIGLGRIGSNVARKLKGIGMKVVAYDQHVAPERFERLGLERCETLDELLPQADLITFHTPKTAETTHLLGAEELAKCKRGVRIVNAARGGLIDEAALYDALVSGQVAGAALDVLEKEPSTKAEPGAQKFENPLLSLDNVIYTPHIGASTAEASLAVSTDVADVVARALKGELVPALNLPQVKGEPSEMGPYLDLASKLGSIYFQTEAEPLTKLIVRYAGSLVREETGLLTLAVQTGLLKPISEERINYVNVKQQVEDLGVEVVEEKVEDPVRFGNQITVLFSTASGKVLEISGTVLGTGEPMLTSFYGYRVDFAFSPLMLALQNKDVPGVIGRVGQVLGDANINITAMAWASKPDKQHAESIISVAKEVPEETMAELRKVDGVLRVSSMSF